MKYKLLVFFLVISIVFPTSYQEYRGVILGLLLIYPFITGQIKLHKISKNIFYIWLLNFIFSSISIFIGVSNNEPGAIRVSTVYIFWPIIYLIFISIPNNITLIKRINKAIVLGGLLSSIVLIMFIANNFIDLPFNINGIAKSQDFSIYWDKGYFELNSMNLATIFYSFIFVQTLLFLPNDLFNNTKKKKNFIILIILGIIILISSRRAFWLVSLLSPFIIYSIYYLIGIKIINLKKSIYILTSICLAIFIFLKLSFNNERIIKEFKSSFEINTNIESKDLRAQQYHALINEWKNNIIIGKGLGSSSKAIIRDPKMPWSYELTYIAILFQTGILGFSIYLISTLWIVYISIKICKKDKQYSPILIPQITALICFLLINFTNPYLLKFDYLWVLFLPIFSINQIKLENEKNNIFYKIH